MKNKGFVSNKFRTEGRTRTQQPCPLIRRQCGLIPRNININALSLPKYLVACRHAFYLILLKESNESKILQEEAHCLRIPSQACPVRAKAGGQPSRSGGGRGERDRGSVESETGGRAEQLQVNTRDRTADTHPRTLWISSTICWHSEWQTPRETRRWAGLFSHANKSAKLDLLNSLHTYLNVDYVF